MFRGTRSSIEMLKECSDRESLGTPVLGIRLHIVELKVRIFTRPELQFFHISKKSSIFPDPEVPIFLNETYVTEDEIDIEWTAPEGSIGGFRVERQPPEGKVGE